METLQGVVDWIGSKEIKGRVYWSFKVGDTFVRTGLKRPSVEKGDLDSFPNISRKINSIWEN